MSDSEIKAICYKSRGRHLTSWQICALGHGQLTFLDTIHICNAVSGNILMLLLSYNCSLVQALRQGSSSDSWLQTSRPGYLTTVFHHRMSKSSWQALHCVGCCQLFSKALLEINTSKDSVIFASTFRLCRKQTGYKGSPWGRALLPAAVASFNWLCRCTASSSRSKSGGNPRRTRGPPHPDAVGSTLCRLRRTCWQSPPTQLLLWPSRIRRSCLDFWFCYVCKLAWSRHSC